MEYMCQKDLIPWATCFIGSSPGRGEYGMFLRCQFHCQCDFIGYIIGAESLGFRGHVPERMDGQRREINGPSAFHRQMPGITGSYFFRSGLGFPLMARLPFPVGAGGCDRSCKVPQNIWKSGTEFPQVIIPGTRFCFWRYWEKVGGIVGQMRDNIPVSGQA